ncbi:uncharacterized protein LOC129595415 [Paramacrobiotus metropolitanus]|uniref:uncharacterized protein LOC129595415 n=1 Tax=Paramacrobiotus metropolitanus TaxID=2943436 RepID=UPI002445EEA0|nr:uncharacterized protein LOC129595415 [Paramacrobiotus metropolitanus]
MVDNSTYLVTECTWNRALGLDENGTGAGETVTTNPSLYVYFVFYPLLLACCTIGSSLTIVARLNDPDSRKTSTTVYMVCSAFGNLCILWSIFPDYLVTVFLNGANAGNDSDQSYNSFTNGYLAYRGVCTFWNETATQFVDWTLIIFALERLLFALRPLSRTLTRAVKATWRRAVLKECIILVLAILFSLCYLCTYYYYYVTSDQKLSLQDSLTPFLRSWYNLQIDAEMGMWFAKWLMLLMLDTTLLVVLWKHRTLVRASVACTKSCATRNANATVIASLLLYMVTQLPYALLTCLKIASRPPYCSYPMTNEQESHARPIINIIQWTNYSVPFFVYYVASLTFRKQCKALYKKISHPARKARGTLNRILTVTTTTSLESIRLRKTETLGSNLSGENCTSSAAKAENI